MERSHFERIKRKKLLVGRGFQLRHMAYVLLAMAIAGAAVSAAFYFGIREGVHNALGSAQVRTDLAASLEDPDRTAVEEGEDPDLIGLRRSEQLSRAKQSVAGEIFAQTNRKLIPGVLGLVFLAVWLSVYLTHRIAGPLYRISKDLHHVIQGDLRTRVALRKNDEGQTLAESVNNAIAAFDISVILLKRIMRRYESDPERMITQLHLEISKFKTSS
ncbi:MAG: hypothetical protein WC352_02480, partial [Candidatus Omnitrophota bacterium]